MKRPRIGIKQWHGLLDTGFDKVVRSFVIWRSNRRVIIDRYFPKGKSSGPYIKARFGGRKWDLTVMRRLSR